MTLNEQLAYLTKGAEETIRAEDLYTKLERAAKNGGRFVHVDLTQIAETTTLMLKDIETLGAERYKTHRVFSKVIR